MAKEKNQSVASLSAYTRAFFNRLQTSKEAGRIYDELRSLKEQLVETEHEQGQTAADAFQKLVESIPTLSPNTVSFLAGLGEDTDVPTVLTAIEEYNSRYENDNKPINMVLTSALPLTEGDRDRIIKAVRQKMGQHHFYITEVIDETLLGGVKLESENFYYDNTIKTKLQEMNDYLLKNQ